VLRNNLGRVSADACMQINHQCPRINTNGIKREELLAEVSYGHCSVTVAQTDESSSSPSKFVSIRTTISQILLGPRKFF
jgi:hypothetical protein